MNLFLLMLFNNFYLIFNFILARQYVIKISAMTDIIITENLENQACFFFLYMMNIIFANRLKV